MAAVALALRMMAAVALLVSTAAGVARLVPRLSVARAALVRTPIAVPRPPRVILSRSVPRTLRGGAAGRPVVPRALSRVRPLGARLARPLRRRIAGLAPRPPRFALAAVMTLIPRALRGPGRAPLRTLPIGRPPATAA